MEEEREDTTIYLKSNINEIYATTELTQYFTNPLDSAIELEITFPIKEEINLSRFIVTIGDKIVLSKVMAKEKAEEKYSDSVASGNTGFISRYNEEMTNYSVNIGNVNPKQKIKLDTVFIQMIGSQDMSYEFNIMEKYPSFHYKEINRDEARNKIIKANFTIETQSKITRLIAPFLDEEAKKESSYEVAFSNDFKKADIKYIKNPDDKKKIIHVGGGVIGKVNKLNFYSSFCILFRTEKMNKPILYYQYNPEFNENSYSINYVYSSKALKDIPVPPQPDQDNTVSYYEKYQNNIINDTPGLFIFLIDQSGSMKGKSIDLVKKALLLFIQSLPPGSYFQLIGFGTSFIKYNKEPVEYNQENVTKIINIIKNLNSDMGNTNISGPLDSVYKDIVYSKINLSKNIFLLTDGKVHDRERCINLITTNANKFRIHALGIGNDFDKVLIERSGKLGNGSSSFVEDVKKINSAVIETLNKCLRHYLTDIKFDFKNYQSNNSNSIIKCNPVNNFTYQDEIMNFSFILDEKNKIDIEKLQEPINIEITGKDPKKIIKENVSFIYGQNIIKFPNGEEMSKMIVGKALKNNQEFKNDKKKEVEFAKKYQMLSKNTALFAEILNDGENCQTKLIKVNLNDYKEVRRNSYGKKGGGFIGARRHYKAAPRILSSRYTEPRMLLKRSFARPMKVYKGSAKLNYSSAMPKIPLATKSINNNNNNYNMNKSMNNTGYKTETEIKDDLTKLIMSQDIMAGSWNENVETKKIISKVTQDKFEKIKKKVKGLKKGEQEIKIIYTLLVIYYLNTKHAKKLSDYKLVINKGKKYLMKQGINYEDFIVGI